MLSGLSCTQHPATGQSISLSEWDFTGFRSLEEWGYQSYKEPLILVQKCGKIPCEMTLPFIRRMRDLNMSLSVGFRDISAADHYFYM